MKEIKVKNFLDNNKDFIKGAKVMENFLNNNENGSSIFQGKLREQDFSAQQKLSELEAAIEELTRQDFLRKAECERQAFSYIDEISSQAELYTEGDDEDYFNGERERVLGDFWDFFEPLFNFFEVNVDQEEVYQMLKEKKEKNWLLSIMKFLRDKIKKIIKKIFKDDLDLSWDKRLDKEIKELQEKLDSGELSEEELARVLERLQTLRDLKFRLQMAVTGWIITMFAEIFGVELAAIVEASKEETTKEDKKAEKTSFKEEANKEVHKDVETKMDEREKPKVPVSLFDISPGFVRPIPLIKPELDLLPNHLKDLMPPIFKEVNENREVKETKPKVEEEKKAKPEEPKKEVCPPKPAEQPRVQVEKNWVEAGDNDKSKKINLDSGNAKKPRRGASKGSSFNAGNFPKVDHFQVPSGTNDGSNASAAQQSSVDDAQPPGRLTDDVKVDEYVKTQSVKGHHK
ncbi:MAG: hypothetical protein ACR5LA_06085 [Wolbachia sp.]